MTFFFGWFSPFPPFQCNFLPWTSITLVRCVKLCHMENIPSNHRNGTILPCILHEHSLYVATYVCVLNASIESSCGSSYHVFICKTHRMPNWKKKRTNFAFIEHTPTRHLVWCITGKPYAFNCTEDTRVKVCVCVCASYWKLFEPKQQTKSVLFKKKGTWNCGQLWNSWCLVFFYPWFSLEVWWHIDW